MNVLHAAELVRIKANTKLNPKTRSALGQFFTPHSLSLYMASLFDRIEGNVSLLDPGCGSGSLTAAFVDESIRRKKINSLNIHAIDIDSIVQPFINETLALCIKKCKKHDTSINAHFTLDNFIANKAEDIGLFKNEVRYSHIIINPPYKKIAVKSEYRIALRNAGIETVNLYAGFVALSIQQLEQNGELVAIIPRSFCNGVYYQPFREFLLRETAIQHIHIFDSRSLVFAENGVLQENIIIHLIKGLEQQSVTITSSPAADFKIDRETQSVTATDLTTRTVSFRKIVKSNDKRKFIHIAAKERDQAVIDRLSYFSSTLDDIKLKVSTGAVVDFRLKDDLRPNIEDGAVPLIYPTHLKGGVDWPKDSKKPNAISVSDKSKSWLWSNSGHFVIVKRFSSKEEKRRVVATHYDGTLPGQLIGFDNKLNVFHYAKQGFDRDIALGLYIYLNSTLLDKYYRLFGGHTQVNATDLRAINYPSLESLKFMGNKALDKELSQKQIDEILEEELAKMAGNDNNPLAVQEKIDRALDILALLGMPKAQQNERSALTLLSLIDLKPDGSWADLKRPMIGVTPIMNWCEKFYGKKYAPNTRETFRRQTLHQFIDGGLCLYNPDKPDRPVNSPKACYQITVELFDILVKYGTNEWDTALADWLKRRETLVANYAKERKMELADISWETEVWTADAPTHMIHFNGDRFLGPYEQ